jgi:hypothetical protein
MTAVMGWLARSRVKKRAQTEARRLVQPLSTLIVGTVSFCFFAALAILSNVYSNGTATWWTTTGFVGFTLLSVPIIISYFVDNHEVSESGLVFTKFIGARKCMRWAEVKSVHYAPLMKWFRVEANSGEVARISGLLMGLPEFARLALAHVPPNSVQPATLKVLQATADGNPPPVW